MVGFVIRGDEVMRRMRDGVVLSIPNVPTYPTQVTLGSRRNGGRKPTTAHIIIIIIIRRCALFQLGKNSYFNIR